MRRMCLNTPYPAVSRASGSKEIHTEAKRKRIPTETILSQNVRGLKSEERLEELFAAIHRRSLFAVCIQETWRTDIEYLERKNCRLMLAGLKEAKCRRGSEGVGIALGPLAVEAWRDAGSVVHNDLGARVIAVRLIVKDLRGKELGLFLVSAYAPVGVAEESEWEKFFDQLTCCLSRKKKDDILILGSDTNSSMGCAKRGERGQAPRKSIGLFGLKHQNPAGLRLQSFLEINTLLALTTCFQKNSYGTWIHPRSKLQHQIDHLITCKCSSYRFIDAGVSESIIDSDHRSVMCKVRIMLKLRRKSSPRQRLLHLDYSQLNDAATKVRFCNSVVEKFAATPQTQSKYHRLESSIKEVSTNTLPKKPRAQPGWFTAAEQELTPLIQQRNLALTTLYRRNSRKNAQKLCTVRKDLKSVVAAAKNRWILDQCKLLNAAVVSRRGTKDYWDMLSVLRKGLSKTRTSTEQTMTKSDGTKCKTPEENAEVFREHFEKLFGRRAVYDASILDRLEQHNIFPGCDHRPTDDEIKKATRKLKNKAPGESGIAPQACKALLDNEHSFQILKEIVLEFWDSELPPREWETGLLKILAKKGDLSKAGNYRGIMLLEIVYKLIAILLHDRLQPIEESLDHESQCGFRPGRGCTDAVYTVKMAMKKRREHGEETWILFLDLVKAFDRVPREMLWDVLSKFGVPPKLISLLKALHAHVEVKFSVNEVTHVIECIIGVKQGDILGPILFTFYLAAVTITWRAVFDRPTCFFKTKADFILTGRSYKAKGESFDIPDSEYADDTGVLFKSRADAEDAIPRLIAHFLLFGMEVHVGDLNTNPVKDSKSEVLFVSAPEKTYEDPESFDQKDLSNIDLGNGVFIPIVQRFKYLGSILTRNCRDDEDVEARITAAGNAFGALRERVFSSGNISYAAKKVVYEGLILSILLYGAESWCLTENLFNQLRCFHARCLRAMCRVNMLHTRLHHISTSQLLGRIGLLSIDTYVTRRQLRWAGHVARMSLYRYPRKMLTSWVRNPRPKGAPQFTYGRGLYKTLKKAEVEQSEWHIIAEDRVKWRGIINSVV